MWMGRLTVKRRRDNRRRSKVQYRKAAPGPPHTRRPLSLIEEIQLMEEEGEEVDSPREFVCFVCLYRLDTLFTYYIVPSSSSPSHP